MNNDMLPVGTTFHINPEDIKWEWNGGDLISRSALKKSIKSYADDQYAENEYLGEYVIMDIIDNAPAVTVDNYAMGYQDGVRKALSERPKGVWVKDEEHSITIEMFKCSICGFWNGAEHFRFCPNCGARMVGDGE